MKRKPRSSDAEPQRASRRAFLKSSGKVAIGSALAGMAIPQVHAAEDNTIRLALIGCGGVGWNVARHIEVAPHYRRPHMALVWTSRGRAVPKIVPRQGSIVHRGKVEEVPSGFEGK